MSYAMLARKRETAPSPRAKAPSKAASSGLRIGEPNDAFEREADRVAEAVLSHRRTPSWSLSKVNLGNVQRQTGPTGPTNQPAPQPNNYKEGLGKIAEAFLKTDIGKQLLDAASHDPVVKGAEDFIGTLPGKIIAGAAAAGAVSALAATHTALPAQIPEIPLDKIRPGLAVKITYEGPVDHPTKAMVTFSYTPKNADKKPKESKSDRFRAETARIAAEQEKFRAGLKYPPGSPQDLQQKAEQKAIEDYTLHRFGAIPGTGGQPLVPTYPGLKESPDTGLRPPSFESPFQPKPFHLLDQKLELKPLTSSTAKPGADAEKKEEPATVQRKAESNAPVLEAPAAVDEALQSSGRPLDHDTRGRMESRFGFDFSKVRVHTDSRAAASAKGIGALAYTVGSDVVFGAGRYLPNTTEGTRLLAHELVHVVQQERGGPSIGGSVGYVVSATSHPAEREADQAATQVLAGRRAHIVQPTAAHLHRAASPQDEQKKAEAKKSHEEEQTKIVGLIGQMRAIKSDPSKGFEDPDNLLHNTLQWLPEPGQPSASTPQVKLTILSPTHDTDSRDFSRGRAYFDSRVPYPNIGGDYPADPAIKTADGLEYALRGTQGQTSFDHVEIFTDTYFDFESLRKVLVHELQHRADESKSGVMFMGLPSAPLLAAEESYKTEFRAFWIQPEPSPPPKGAFVPPVNENFGASQEPAVNADPVTVSDPAACKVCTAGKQSVPTKFKNRKQENIFWYLLKTYKLRQFDCFYVCSPDFRKLVTEFVFPESVNLVNSIRIQTLSAAIQSCTPQMTLTDPALVRAVAAARRLDAIDRQFLQVEEQSGPFWDQVKAHIPNDLLDTITSLIKTGKMVPEAPGDYERPRENVRGV